ncbi:MAG TPA: co-chaperone GroES [Candidatus Nanopelagicales bacterium]|nr:co-chaperone GroES [Candidatus Nanopelagicales bacterium]
MTPANTPTAAPPDTRPGPDGAVPIKLLHDRVLVREGSADGERKSSGGIVIPANAQVGRRLNWASVVAVGPNVRSVEVGDSVLFEPEDRGTVELQGIDYVLLRERDLHAVAAGRHATAGTGLYL